MTAVDLEKVFDNSTGGPCTFPEPEDLTLPIEGSSMRIKKRVRGNGSFQKEYKNELKGLIAGGQITQEEFEQWKNV